MEEVNNNPENKYKPVAGTQKEARALLDQVENRNNIKIVHSNAMVSSNDKSSRSFLYFAACTGNLAAFTCGICFGWSSPELPKFKSLEDNPLGYLISKAEEGWIVSLLAVGAILGPLAAGIAVDKIGRKSTLLIGNIPFIIAFVLNSICANVIYLYLSRFLCGLAVGVIFTVLPMYIGEIAEDEVRGSLGSFMQLFITLGLLFSYILGPYLSVRLFNLICLICPAAFLLIVFLFVPESPHYLVQKGNKETAENSLMKLRGKSKEDVGKEMEIIKTHVDEALADKINFFAIFKSRGLTKALLLSVGLVTMQQLSGINVILFYAQDIFQEAGVSLAPEICTIIIGIVQVVSSGCSSLLIENKGKRFLLILSSIGMALAEAILAIFFYIKDTKHLDVSEIAWLPIASLVLFIVMYCLGFGPVPWAMVGELFPSNIKSVASTATAISCWMFAFVLTRYFVVVTDIIGTCGTFGIFTGCCLLAAVFVYKFLPETSGKSLKEIQDILNGNQIEEISEKGLKI